MIARAAVFVKMARTNMDYRNTLFKTARLSCHTGEPTLNVICNLHNILKTNAANMHTSLGGIMDT